MAITKDIEGTDLKIISDEDEEFIDMKEALKMLKITEPTFREKYIPKLKQEDVKEVPATKMKGGIKKMYKKSTLSILEKEEEEDLRVSKIVEKSTKIADKNSMLVTANDDNYERI